MIEDEMIVLMVMLIRCVVYLIYFIVASYSLKGFEDSTTICVRPR